MSEGLDLTPELRDWITRLTAAEPVAARRLGGGGSRHTILIDALAEDGGERGLVLRMEGGGSHSGTDFTLEREYHVYRALADTDVPVPRVFGVAADGSALLLERLAGESAFEKLNDAEKAGAARAFMTALGQLHALDPRRLDLPGFALPSDPQEHATLELGRWEALARPSCWDEPMVRFIFAALRATPPASVQRTSIIHGDAGPGNFLVADGRITGLIDWEFAHVGDPMDDLGWLRMRARETYDLFAAALPEYERVSGVKVDAAALDYYEKTALLRCAVTVALGQTKGGALGVIPYRYSFWTYLSRLADHMVSQSGLTIAKSDPPDAAGGTDAMYSLARAELRQHVMGQLEAPRARTAVQAVMTALTSLELRERFGQALAEQDRAERLELLGQLSDDELLVEAERAGAAGDPTMLRYLARRTWRERSLWPR